MIWLLRSDYWTIGKDGRIEEFAERRQRASEPLADAGMARAVAHRHMLALELDAKRRDGVSLFPLWLGYVLVVDALVAARTGSSMWTRSRKEFVLLFVASSPVWWMFEVINHRTANWQGPWKKRFRDIRVLSPLHDFLFDGDAGGV